MPVMIVYFLLGAVAMGIVMLPFLRKGDPTPPTSAAPEAPVATDKAAAAPGEARLFGYPRAWVLSGGGALAVLLAAGALYTMTGDKTQPTATATAAGGVASPGAPPSLPDVDTLMTRLEKRLETRPNDPDGWRMLGWSYYATQKYDRSVKAYAHAVALRPDNPAFQSAYGEALTKASGDKVTADAQSAFRKALSLDPRDARARIYMARLRHERGDSKGAIEELFGILNSQAPDSGEALAARQAIRKVSADSGISVADRLPPEAPATPAAPAAAPPATAEAASGLPGPTAAQVQAAQQMSAGDRQSMIEGMIGKLEARLATSPRDVDGWIMLIRSRKQMGQDDKARAALTHGLAAFADDAAARGRISDAARTYGVP